MWVTCGPPQISIEIRPVSIVSGVSSGVARTDGVNSDTIRVAIAEGAVGMQSVESVIFVIFSIDNWKIGFNPGVHSILDFLSSSEVSL